MEIVTPAEHSATCPSHMSRRQLYEENAKIKYERRMRNFEIRCYRAAQMNFAIASNYDYWAFWIEMLSYFLGVCGVVTCLDVLFERFVFNRAVVSRPWLFALLILFFIVAGILYVSTYWSVQAYPSFRDRAKQHNDAAGKWQVLQEEMKSHRWALEDPHLPIEVHINNYNALLKEREKAVNTADIPTSTYEEYETQKKVQELLDRMKKQRELYTTFKDIYDP